MSSLHSLSPEVHGVHETGGAVDENVTHQVQSGYLSGQWSLVDSQGLTDTL